MKSSWLICLLAVVFLSACSPPLRESLPIALAGKDLSGRLQVLDATCAEHARRHFGRRDPDTGQLQLPQICRNLSARIREASRTKQAWTMQADMESMISQCYAEGRHVRFNNTRGGASQVFMSPNKALLTQDSQLLCARYKLEFAQLLRASSSGKAVTRPEASKSRGRP